MSKTPRRVSLSRDEWASAFVDVLVSADRPKRLARQVALPEWTTHGSEDPAKVARAWLRRQGESE
jgi:hypothetical protein